MANDGNSEALLMLPSKLVLAGSFQVWPSLASAGFRLMMFMAWAISLISFGYTGYVGFTQVNGNRGIGFLLLGHIGLYGLDWFCVGWTIEMMVLCLGHVVKWFEKWLRL